MWGVGASGFFSGFDRVDPRKWGKKGCLGAVLVLVVGGLVLGFLAAWLGIMGVALFMAAVLVITWVPINRIDRANRAREADLRRELRRASEDDSGFRLGDPSGPNGSNGPGGPSGPNRAGGPPGR